MDLEETLKILNAISKNLYKQYGASDEVIQLQAAINAIRTAHNLPDEENTDVSNEGFVQ